MSFQGPFFRAAKFFAVPIFFVSQLGCQSNGHSSEVIGRQAFNKHALLDARKTAVVQGTKAGVFQDYVNECLDEISKSWDSLNPKGYDKTMRGAAIFRITVQDDGGITDVEVLESSGDHAFDRTIFRSVKKSASCGPFPINLATDYGKLIVVQTFSISS